MGFSGTLQVTTLTGPVPMLIQGKPIITPLLHTANTSLNLLGRDILCSLKAQIMCTADGVHINVPDQSPLHMMTIMEQTATSQIQQPEAYWLRLTPEQSMLQHHWQQWDPNGSNA